MKLPQSIIIIEDEVITQQYIAEILTNESIEVLAYFDNAKDTLIRMPELSPDIIIMDINLAGPMDGITLAREILNKIKIPIIFVTAYSDDITREEVSELDDCGFIAKPFRSEEIIHTVKDTYNKFLNRQTRNLKNKDITDILLSDEYMFSYKDHTLYSRDEALELNNKQNELINILVKNYRHPVSLETLKIEIWEREDISDSALRTLIYSVRKLAPNLQIIPFTKIGYSIS